MPEPALRTAVIIGSNREGRFGGVVAGWFVAQARLRTDMDVEVIDLAEVELPAVFPRHPGPPVEEYLGRLAGADAFVVVTPEYNHGYPAGLKQAIDLAHDEWRAKPVAFVSYGGMAGGLRAVEQLRQVFAELHATTIRDTVSFHDVWHRFDEAGEPRDAAECDAAVTVMLDQLAWWASALRTARRQRPAGDDHAAALRRLYDEGFGNGDLGVVDEVVHRDFVHHAPFDGQAPGVDGLKDMITSLRRSFADFSMTPVDVVVGIDRVATRLRITGATASGASFDVEELVIARFDGGRIAELWSQSEHLPFENPFAA